MSPSGPGMVALIRPGSVLGQNSAVDPSALPEGSFPLLQNLRLDSAVPTVRDGVRKLTTSPIAGTPSFRGAWEGTLNGTHYIVAAYKQSSDVGIYTLSESSWTWTEITPTSGLFGNTRLAQDAENCAFCKVPVKWQGTSREVLLISNGPSSSVRVWDPAQATAALRMSKLNEIDPGPGDARNYLWFQYWPRFYNLQTLNVTFTADGSGKLVAAWGGTVPNRYVGLTMAATSLAGKWAALALEVPLNLTGSKQLVFRVEQAASAVMFSALKIELQDNSAGWYTVYDPSGATSPLTQVPDLSPGVSNVVYYAASLAGVDAGALDAVTAIRFTTTAAGYGVTKTIKVGLIAPSGCIPGLADWSVAFRNAYSGIESAGRVLSYGGPSASGTFPVAGMGGCSFATDGSPAELIPNSSQLNYVYDCICENPHGGSTVIGDLGNYPTHVDYYIRYDGTGSYTYFGSEAAFTPDAPNGRWLGTQAGHTTFAKAWGDGDSATANASVAAPDAFNGYAPRPTSMVYSGDRLFMGGTGGAKADLLFSDYANVLRFRQVVRFDDAGKIDPLSGGQMTFGAEVTGIAPTGNVVNGVEFGVPAFLIWTVQDAYRLYGLDAETLLKPAHAMPHGLSVRGAWARYQNGVFWLDHNRQVVRLDASATLISRGTVDRLLRAGSVSSSSMAFFNDRLYVTYRRAEDSSTMRLLVWDERKPGTWTEDLVPGAAEGLLVCPDASSGRRLLYFDAGSSVWRHEDPTMATDVGAPIPVRVVARELQQGPWEAFVIRKVGLVADGCGSGSTADVTVTYKPNGATARWTAATGNPLSLDAGPADQVWRRTSDLPVLSTEEIRGLSATVDFQANMAARKRIYSLIVWVEPRNTSEDQA